MSTKRVPIKIPKGIPKKPLPPVYSKKDNKFISGEENMRRAYIARKQREEEEQKQSEQRHLDRQNELIRRYNEQEFRQAVQRRMKRAKKSIPKLSNKSSNERVKQLKKNGYEVKTISTPEGDIIMKRRSTRVSKPVKNRRIKPEHGYHYKYLNNLDEFIKYYLYHVIHKSYKGDTLFEFLTKMFSEKKWYSFKTMKWRKY